MEEVWTQEDFSRAHHLTQPRARRALIREETKNPKERFCYRWENVLKRRACQQTKPHFSNTPWQPAGSLKDSTRNKTETEDSRCSPAGSQHPHSEQHHGVRRLLSHKTAGQNFLKTCFHCHTHEAATDSLQVSQVRHLSPIETDRYVSSSPFFFFFFNHCSHQTGEETHTDQ